ncbi:hypothetical protein ALP98_101378 [Pseudomonas viridiflava]|uniref:Uncharacterized protein n=2 Tax=Pseudomonas syringae group TaxID=136849 RepID=A0A3M4PNH4_PSEVI|nr:hypothetical protein ALQ30_101025 [Pseudomonas syringae pv. persicae]RMQ79677.1 hypothetical protein ALP98_101378 [Pseudomonas viridiflava]
MRNDNLYYRADALLRHVLIIVRRSASHAVLDALRPILSVMVRRRSVTTLERAER